MEQEAFNSEKNVLFEKIKSELAKQLKKDNILFLVWCLILTAGLVVCAVRHYILLGQLVYTILFVVSVLLSFHSSHWLGKMAKAATAQELLSIYDKNRVIERWKVVLDLVIVLLVSFYFMAFKDAGALSTLMMLPAVAANNYRPTVEKMSDDIEDLRFL